LAQLFATFSRNRLPPDEWTRMVGAAQTVTTAKLLEATRQRLRPAEATIVIVGDAEKLLPSLSKLMGLSPQQISRRDTNGLPLMQ
jgi:predicted Zn-dependent peptidase